jgi:low affinity Fe/Cu permease
MGFFRSFSSKVSSSMGHPAAFLVALISVLVWAGFGPLCDYSDTWQLAINTTTTIITFLMVFLIQNLQTRDTKAMQLKLDELIWANKLARNHLIDLESLSDEEMDELHREFCQFKEQIDDRVEDINAAKKRKSNKK